MVGENKMRYRVGTIVMGMIYYEFVVESNNEEQAIEKM